MPSCRATPHRHQLTTSRSGSLGTRVLWLRLSQKAACARSPAQESAAADRLLAPIASIRGLSALRMTQAEYLSLFDYTGRQIRADKRGAIERPAPAALARLGCRPETWTRQVLAEVRLQPGSGRGRMPDRESSRDGSMLVARDCDGAVDCHTVTARFEVSRAAAQSAAAIAHRHAPRRRRQRA